MRKRILISAAIALAVALIACAAAVYYAHHPRIGIDNDPLSTNRRLRFVETAAADSLLVGHWVEKEHPTRHKIYYDDPAEDGFYWGKMWDEADDIAEEDLLWHGNGWFRWKKEKDTLLELPRMDHQGVNIPVQYVLQDLTDCQLVYTSHSNQSFRQQYTFIRCE